MLKTAQRSKKKKRELKANRSGGEKKHKEKNGAIMVLGSLHVLTQASHQLCGARKLKETGQAASHEILKSTPLFFLRF